MIHPNALGLILQQTFSILTTRSGSSSSTTRHITLNWTNYYLVPTQVLLSSLSRASLYAIAYLILCILTTDHSLLPENSKNLHPPGLWPPNVLTTLSTIKWQDWKCCKDSQEVANQSKSKWTRSILGHFGLAQHTFTSIGSSPVQRLFGRRTKTLLPTAGTLLQRKIMEETEDKLKERKTKQALFYNKGTKELPELQPGDTVHMKPLPSDKEKLWRKGSVVKQVAPRSYEVDLQGTMFRRNRRHLVKTKEPSPQLDLESQENLPASDANKTW